MRSPGVEPGFQEPESHVRSITLTAQKVLNYHSQECEKRQGLVTKTSLDLWVLPARDGLMRYELDCIRIRRIRKCLTFITSKLNSECYITKLPKSLLNPKYLTTNLANVHENLHQDGYVVILTMLVRELMNYFPKFFWK